VSRKRESYIIGISQSITKRKEEKDRNICIIGISQSIREEKDIDI
jgi:hypothetical protein